MAEIKMKGALNVETKFTQQGDYLIPELEAPENPKVGKFGMLHRSFLMEHRNGIYSGLLLTGELNQHLEEIDRQADEMESRLMRQMALREGVTEQMKASNPMLWVQRMENIRNRAEEIVLNDLIYS